MPRNMSFGQPPPAGTNWRSQHLNGGGRRCPIVETLRKQQVNRIKGIHKDHIHKARLDAMNEQTTQRFNRQLKEANNWAPKSETRGLERSSTDAFELTFGPRYLDTLRKDQHKRAPSGSQTARDTRVRQSKWAGFDYEVRPKSANAGQHFSSATAKIISRQAPGKRVPYNPSWNKPVPFTGYGDAGATSQGFSNTRGRGSLEESEAQRQQTYHLRDIARQSSTGIGSAQHRNTYGNRKLLPQHTAVHSKQRDGWTTTSATFGSAGAAPTHESRSNKQSWYGLSANEQVAFRKSQVKAGMALTGEKARLAAYQAEGRTNMLQVPRAKTTKRVFAGHRR